MLNKELYQDKYRINSARLYGYDYAWPGYYFVTICTKDMVNYFGEVINYKMVLNDLGQIADKFWREIPLHYPFVQLGEFAVMPNHVHGVVIICPAAKNKTSKLQNISDNKTQHINDSVETYNYTSLRRRPDIDNLPINNLPLDHHPKFASPGKNLSSIVRGFKIGVKKYATMNKIKFCWQFRFYDIIVRNKYDLIKIENYIQQNPANWKRDRNHPLNVYY